MSGTRIRGGLLAAALLFFAASLAAEITAETRWADPPRVELSVEFPGEGYHANWQLFGGEGLPPPFCRGREPGGGRQDQIRF